MRADNHYHTSLAKYQASVDAQEAIDLMREEDELEAERDFDIALATRNINAQMPRTETRDFERCKETGRMLEQEPRLQTLSEIIWDWLYEKNNADLFTQALVQCAAKGNIEAVEVMELVKAQYVSDRVNTGVPT